MSLLLSFGRTTFGGLTTLLPGSNDIFMRRFMMGVQLAGLLLAGRGRGGTVAPGARRAWRRWGPPGAAWAGAPHRGRGRRWWPVALVGVAVLAPAWTQIDGFAAHQHRS